MQPIDEAQDMRHADAGLLATALQQGRANLLALLDTYQQALPDAALRVPQDASLNLPLWELGHIGWFEEFWLSRFTQRERGALADPDAPRGASLCPNADALYDSSRIAHATRWQLALPDTAATLGYLEQVRQRSLALLADEPAGDAALYFFRLVLFHEDMHREAWAYMAQHLGLDVAAALEVATPAAVSATGEWSLPKRRLALGSAAGGFAFDNELAQHPVEIPATRIDRGCVSWQRFLPFVEAGGYAQRRWWSDAGWAWKGERAAPRYVQQRQGRWQRRHFGAWSDIDLHQPAINLSWHEAQAWCRWAGRHLPSEAEWESAALRSAAGGEPFEWGQVWEWTASAFAPYPGFAAHPYRDYSQPFFDGRPVLRGASFASAARMKHPRYRNYFSADRNDIFAGFRSCAA